MTNVHFANSFLNIDETIDEQVRPTQSRYTSNTVANQMIEGNEAETIDLGEGNSIHRIIVTYFDSFVYIDESK